MYISWIDLSQIISSVLGEHHNLKKITPITGGSINTAFKACSDKQCFFIKINNKAHLPMFCAEEKALIELASQTQTSLRIPQPICTGQVQQYAFIAMEFITMMPMSNSASSRLGEQLAQMHYTQQISFGWHQNNTIGLTQQINAFNNDWGRFWQKNRLEFQLKQAKNNGMPSLVLEQGYKLQQNLSVFFTDYQPYPSLLHGDLWGGNVSSDTHDKPVIYDPAVYYGDRETDLAMTELFGGFSVKFYQAYNATLPLDAGYTVRKNIYNLYHLLNHFNLFGEGYLSQVKSTLNRLQSEINA